jgi:hypothetical protein
VHLHFLYIRLTVLEARNNNNDDRHIKKRENKSYCQFFLPFLSVFLSPFQSSSTKKNRGEKKKEAAHRPTSLSATPPYAKLSPSCFAIRSLTYISTASSSLSSKFYYITSITASYLFDIFFLRIFLNYLHLQLLACRQYPPNVSYFVI